MRSRPYYEVAIISGKGGTGKTTLAGSFAALADNAVIADADVDAANLHLLLRADVQETFDLSAAQVAVRDEAACKKAGECQRRCRFDAITTEAVNPFACEGCGLCVLACPNNALSLEPYVCGQYYVSQTPYGPMVHAHLSPGAENSGKLVTAVRSKAEDIALAEHRDLIIIDGPPGIGCTAIAAVTDVDLVAIVTEPTMAAMQDMARAVQLASHFQIPTCVFINKSDLNADNTRQIQAACADWDLPIIGRLPYDQLAAEAIAAARPLVEYAGDGLAQSLRSAWDQVRHLLSMA